MKILLTILCALMVLFAGGCTLVLFTSSGIGTVVASGGFALVPVGVTVLNLAVLGGLWGFFKATRWVFILLAILDIVAVGVLIVFWASLGFSDQEFNLLAGLTAGAFALKSALTFGILKGM